MTEVRTPRGNRGRLVWLFALPLAAASGWHALVMTNRAARPAVALALDSSEPIALARTAALAVALADQKKQPVAREVSDLSRRSIRGFAPNPQALSALATASDPALSSDRAAKLVALADKVSQRDLFTQLLRIRLGLAKGDLEQVLDAYNKALTAQEGSWATLFPPLSQLLRVEEGRDAFVFFMRQNPPWLFSFFQFALNRTTTPQDYYDLLVRRNWLAKVENNGKIQNLLVNSLVANRRWREAGSAFAYGGKSSADVLFSPRIDANTAEKGGNTLLWFFPEADGRSANVIGKRFLSVTAEPGRRGTVAQKILYLAPGRYTLSTRYDGDAPSPDVETRWIMQCLTEPEGATNELAVVRQNAGSVRRDTFTIGPQCAATRLLLDARGNPSAPFGGEVVISDISLKRAG